MTALYGANYTNAYNSNPSVRPNIGEYGGSLKILLDTSILGVQAIAADTLAIGKLPKNAKIISVSSSGLGAGGSVNIAPLDFIDGTIKAAPFDVIATVGAGPAASVSVWIEYVVC